MSEYYTKEELLEIGFKKVGDNNFVSKKLVFTLFRAIWDQTTGLMIFV